MACFQIPLYLSGVPVNYLLFAHSHFFFFSFFLGTIYSFSLTLFGPLPLFFFFFKKKSPMIMTRVFDRWSRPNHKHLVCASSSSLSACVVSEHQREDPLHGEKGDDPVRFSTPSSTKSSPFWGAGQ